jgi:PAS domain S-box-containing protein
LFLQMSSCGNWPNVTPPRMLRDLRHPTTKVEIESRTDEIRRLKAFINDLVSVLALPAIWSGRAEPSHIGNTLLDVLLGLLRLDFAYLRLGDSFGGGAPMEMVHVGQRRHLTAQPEEVGRALNNWLTEDPSTSPFLVPNPVGKGKTSIALRHLGLQDQIGVLVAGSARADFPTKTERVILDVAVNQAAVGLHETRRLIEQRQIAQELDHRVAQRTRELVERDARIRRLVDANIIGVLISELEGQILESNDAFLKMVGYSREDLVSGRIRWTDMTPTEWQAVTEQAVAQIKATGACDAFEKEYVRKDGTRVPVLVGAAGFGGNSSVAFVVDLTERKRAEEAVRQSEKQLRDVIETMPVIAFTTLSDGSIDFVNRRWIEYTGLTAEEAGFYRQATVDPEDIEGHLNKWQASLASGEPFENEVRHRGADGQYRWFLVRGVPLRDEHGKILKWFGTLTDIEDRKQAEERLRKENVVLREEIDKGSMFEEIVGASAALQGVLALIAKVAPTDSTVLITGETGTGKELIARAIHKKSQRSGRAFVGVNCAAIPRDLIPSELFGHEKGAFTGAMQRRLGRFELADGGTIFLDEVGELLPDTQVALLRVLQEREFERVGGGHPIHVDVRVIAATNRDLKAAVANGTFRQDLFYRLNVFPIEVPPLRKRKDDILMLVEYFVQRYASRAGKHIRSIEKKTLDLLQSYDWPGNIRELQNVIERSVILSSGDSFSVDELWLSKETPPPASRVKASAPFKVEVEPRSEREIIEAALAATRGRVSGPSGAATKLGIPPSTLETRIKALKINKAQYKFR